MKHADAPPLPVWKGILLWMFQWVLFWCAWMLFVCKFNPDEMIIGIAAAALAAIASHRVWATHLAALAGKPKWYLQGWRIPWYALHDTWQILIVLAKQIFLRRRADSLLLAVRFDAGGHDAESATRRALAVAYTTMTPGSIVVGIDRSAGLLLYHQVRRGKVPIMTQNLGAQP